MEKKYMERLVGKYCKIVTKEPGEERANVVSGILEDVDYKDGFILVDSEQGLGCLRINTIVAIKPGRKHKKECEKIKEDEKSTTYKLDRLGRNLDHLIKIIDKFKREGINFVSITENLNTTSATGKLQFHMLAALAEFNRELIRERTLEGLAIARKKGKILGKKPCLNEIQKQMIDNHLEKGFSKYDIAKMIGLKSRSPIYTYLKNKG